ncbi:hypothetical protein IEQ34_013210 [Dendrobium chrysotoxum]|uniref:Uncharacterized protein n=1 Tax=Dendrobium chrysotoxum TaxID=161865 RepID=A0AAV7GQY1_DENCH|nr:hypothetical protein IEQ34_013210 [Dendrobium chrysotoxum]
MLLLRMAATHHLFSAKEDGQALIWKFFTTVPTEGFDHMLAYHAGTKINQLQWPAAHRDWTGVSFSNKV